MFEDDDGIVPLANINSTVLERILRWTEFHNNNPERLEDTRSAEYDITSWYEDFLEVDHATLFALLKAAMFLEISGLTEFVREEIADIIKYRAKEIQLADDDEVQEESEWLESYV